MSPEKVSDTFFAVIADLHLPDRADSAQDAFLDWALGRLAEARPAVTVVAGDATAIGTVTSARRLREKLERSGLPFLITPGNSDRRAPQQWEQVQEALRTQTSRDCGGMRLLLADTSDAALPAPERARLEHLADEAAGRRLVLITHCPPESLDAESRAWLEAWIARRRPALVLAAHRHVDRAYEIAGVPAWLVRGLDPDKAIGGPPAVNLAHLDGASWRREDLAAPLGDPRTWPDEERAEFSDLLGVSCMEEPLGGLEFALHHGVRCVELRGNAAGAPPDRLRALLDRWRRAGGSWLSWHMPNVVWDEAAHAVADEKQWREELALALALGVQALTVHVPRVPLGLMTPGSDAWRGLSDMLCGALAPAVEAGVCVAVENLRMRPGEAPDDARGFGYLPAECLAWGDELRGRLGEHGVGHLLDIGHARNNAPFSSEFTLAAWYALLGPRLAGFHLHQVLMQDGQLRNHQPIRCLHGPLISLSSFFWAWETGQLARAPMFLEIRDPAALADTLATFRRALGAG